MKRWFSSITLIACFISGLLLPLHSHGATTVVNNVSAQNLTDRLIQNSVANVVVSAPIIVTSANQTGLVDNTALGTVNAVPLTLPATGIMLTTGNVSGTGANLGRPGDADVFNELGAAAGFVTTGTFDGSSLQFDFTVPVNTPSISFEFVFATNEAIGNAQFTDAAVVLVDGVNYAKFANGALVSSSNAAVTFPAVGVITGFANSTGLQRITCLLDPARATHTIKIAIADNNDGLTDSAFIATNFLLSASTGGGIGFGDISPPAIVAPVNVTMEATGPTTLVNLGTPVVTDNVDVNPRATAAPAGPYPVGITNVVWSSTDAAGNVGTATQVVTITDLTAPVITPPANTTFTATTIAGASSATPVIAAWLASATAIDLVNAATVVVNNAPAILPLGTTLITFTSTDAGGNSSTATATVTISNQAAPVAVNDTNAASLALRLSQNAAGMNVTAPVAVAVAVANQTGLVNTVSFGNVNAVPLVLPASGIMLTTGNINGAGGNLGRPGDTDVFNELVAAPGFATTGTFDASSLQFSFTVPANTPSITFDFVYATNEAIGNAQFPDSVVVMVDGVNYAKYANGQLISSQNAGVVFPTAANVIPGYANVSNLQRLTCLLNPALAVHTIKIAIADNNDGLTDSAFIATNLQLAASTGGGIGFGDISPPAIEAPVNVTMEATGPTTLVNLGTPVVTDNVDVNPRATPAPAGPYAVGVTNVVWSSTDVAGNVGTAIQVVTITDTTAPVMTPPANTTFTAATIAGTPAVDPAIAAWLASAVALDLVDGVTAIVHNAPVTLPLGASVITFTATDAAGNISTTTAAITISNQAAPIAVANNNALTLASRLTVNAAGMTVTAPVAVAAANQTGLVNTVSFGNVNAVPLVLPASGIMLTTGNINGAGGNLGRPGDTDVFNELIAAPGFATTGTFDASSLQFNFTVPANTPSISFDFVYATNEIIGNAQFPDSVVVMVDGVNYAKYANGQLVSSQNAGVVFPTAANVIPGYANVSNLQRLTGLLNPALAVHTIKIAIADNNDGLTDSALIATNLQLAASTGGGIGFGDISPPVITPAAAITMEATAAMTPVNLGAPLVVDNVDPNPRATAAPAGPYPVGITNVVWSSTDAAGNIGTATQIVTITDLTAPVITPPLDATFTAATITGTSSADPAAAAWLASAAAIDLVDGVTAVVHNAPAILPMGASPVTFTTTDVAGNVSTAVAIITISNQAAPIGTANSNALTLASRLAINAAGIVVTAPAAVAALNQTGLVNTLIFGNVNALPLILPAPGIMLTTGNINGAGGNLGLPGDVDVFNALVAAPASASTGTFDASSLQFSFTTPLNTPSISFDFIYASNEATGIAQFSDSVVVMVDGINYAKDAAGQLLSSQNAGLLFATAANVIPGYTNVSTLQRLTCLLNPALTVHTIKIAIADNSSAITDSAFIASNLQVSASTGGGIGFGDISPPVIIPAADIIIEATGLMTLVNLGAPVVTDNLDPNPTVTATPVGPYPLGVTQVTWRATDASGNSATAIQAVTITDTVPPVLTMPAVASTFAATNITGLPASDPALAAVLASVSATDALGIRSIANNAPANFPVGTTTVAFTATDNSGLSTTATTDIIVTSFVPAPGGGVTGPGIDQIPPVMKLKGSPWVTVLQGSIYDEVLLGLGAIAKDNVDGILTGAIVMNIGVNTSIPGTYIVAYSVTDAAGNNTSISRTVSVVTPIAGVDVEPPVITPPPDLLVAAVDYEGTPQSDADVFAFLSEKLLPNQLTGVMAIDNVGVVGAITNDAPAIFPVGKTVVTFTAVDAAGNRAIASAVVTVSGTRFEPRLDPADDTDADGISDAWEVSVFGGLISTGAPGLPDSDGDSIPDSWEAALFSSLLVAGVGTDFDQDGLLDSEEQLLGTDPKAANTNPASVGARDSNDIVFALDPSDSDGDGILDVFENASSVMDPTVATGIPSAGRTTNFTIDANGNALKSVSVNQLPYSPPSWLQRSFGVLAYNVTTTVGATITVRVSSTTPFGASAPFYKVDQLGNYTLISPAHYVQIDTNTVDFTLTDGGALDLDGVANGIIVDPIAIGAPVQIVGGSGGGPVTGGSGCVMRPGDRFDPLFPVLFAVMLLLYGLRERRLRMFLGHD